MGDAQVFYGIECPIINIVESAAAVFSLAAVDVEFGLLVSEKPDKKLIDIHIAKLGNFIQIQTL